MMRSISIQNWLRGFGLATGMFLVSGVQADTPVFVLGSVSTNEPLSFTGSRGWMFRHSAWPGEILVTQLGVFDSGGDGLVNAHQIGLWRQVDNVTGTLLASATVPAGTAAPLLGGYRWVSIAPVLIPDGVASYVVAAQYSTGDADDLVTPQPDFSHYDLYVNVFTLGGRAALGTDLPYPAGFWPPPCEGCPAPRFWEPNLQYVVVPEPAVWWLVVPLAFYWLVRQGRACGKPAKP